MGPFLRKFNIKCSVIFYRLEVIRENRLFLYAYWNGWSFCFSLDFPAESLVVTDPSLQPNFIRGGPSIKASASGHTAGKDVESYGNSGKRSLVPEKQAH